MKNPIIIFVSSRYIIYALQFIRGMGIAYVLGPELYGIWGFLMLIQSYLSYGTLGVEYALNVILSTEKNIDNKTIQQYYGTSVIIITFVIVPLIILATAIQFDRVNIFEEYQFSRYAILLAFLVATTYFQQIFVNIYRYYGLLQDIVYVEFITALFTILPIIIFSGEELISILLGIFFLTAFLGNTYYLIKSPIRMDVTWNRSTLYYLLILAIPLFGYNFVANLMTMLSRTIISQYYSIESLGFYTFAFNISNSVFLGISAISWAIFPEILSGMRKGLDDITVINLLHKTNRLFGDAAFMIVMIVILFSPIIFLFLDSYRPVIGLLGVLLISQAVGALMFGYTSLLYSRRKIFLLILINIIGVAFGIGLSLIVSSNGISYHYIAVAVVIGQLLQLFILIRATMFIINFNSSFWEITRKLFTAGRVCGFVFVLGGVIIGPATYWNMSGAVIFMIFDRDHIRSVISHSIRQLRS